MPYLPDINTYLHNSSLLIQAYPNTRITTKYSLPRKPNSHRKSSVPSKRSQKAFSNTTDPPPATENNATQDNANAKDKDTAGRREPSATLTLKTFHAESGICLKYRTDKAQEVGRLMAGLGRLAMGEVLEMPTSSSAAAAAGDAMDIDTAAPEKAVPEASVVPETQVQQNSGGASGGGGGGGKKKKKGKK